MILLLTRLIHVTLLQLCQAEGRLPFSWLLSAREHTQSTLNALPSVCQHIFSMGV